MMKVRCAVPWLATALVAVALSGCGNKNLGQVTGTVTMDGEPVPDATVMFTPLSGGRPAAGITDSQGRYELVFDREDTGAQLGEHVVEITTGREEVGEDDTVTEIPETVPAKYNMNTELRATIEAGSNTFDFALESGGEIMTEEDAVAESEAEAEAY